VVKIRVHLILLIEFSQTLCKTDCWRTQKENQFKNCSKPILKCLFLDSKSKCVKKITQNVKISKTEGTFIEYFLRRNSSTINCWQCEIKITAIYHELSWAHEDWSAINICWSLIYFWTFSSLSSNCIPFWG